jgi:integrase
MAGLAAAFYHSYQPRVGVLQIKRLRLNHLTREAWLRGEVIVLTNLANQSESEIVKHNLARENPVNKADLSVIKNRRPKKSALDLNDIDYVASVLDGYDRAYFNVMRYTGLRMDEANRARWEDIDFDGGWIEVRGTKTEGSADIIPLAPVLRADL